MKELHKRKTRNADENVKLPVFIKYRRRTDYTPVDNTSASSETRFIINSAQLLVALFKIHAILFILDGEVVVGVLFSMLVRTVNLT